MAITRSWKVYDDALPVREIEYYHTNGIPPGLNLIPKPPRTTLKVCFDDEDAAKANLDLLQELDEGCWTQGNAIVMSNDIAPRYLAGFLLENGAIDQLCYEELQTETEDLKAVMPRQRNKRDSDKGNEKC